MRTITFSKGHGTHNDFVIVKDRHAMASLDEDTVRFLCDRRGGIGGDGLLRVTKASSIPEWEGDPDLWFMDYRNGDGSIAEMCGNGLRVFVRYLLDSQLVPNVPLDIATRAGVRRVQPMVDGNLKTWMGTVRVDEVPTEVRARFNPDQDGHNASGSWLATKVDVGNPHAVCFLAEDQQLVDLDLTREPGFSRTDFPEGTNVEFVTVLGERHLALRVHERGAGETMSCGTGTVAVAAAWARRAGLGDGDITVEVPGGTLVVGLEGDQATLCGPAVIVAHGEVVVPD